MKSKALSGKRKDQEQTVLNQIKNEANNPTSAGERNKTIGNQFKNQVSKPKV